ncbi:YciI family protein [Anaerosporobacter sp.]
MKCFIVEGTITKPDLMTDSTMNEHIAYSQKAMDEGRIVMSGLKSDMSGGLFIMKAESLEQVDEYLLTEPLRVAGVQEYRIIEYSPHYINKNIDEWLDME